MNEMMGNCANPMSSIQEHFDEALNAASRQLKHLKGECKKKISFYRVFDIDENERVLNYAFVDDGDTYQKIILKSKIRLAHETETKQADYNEDAASQSTDIDEEGMKWIDREDWEVVLDRIAVKKKPLATVPLVGKLDRHFFRRVLERRAHELNVRVIGPYQNDTNGQLTFTLVHSDSLDNAITLGDLLSPDDKELFRDEKSKMIFSRKLAEYLTKCDIRYGQSYLECPLIYGYPLHRALEMDSRSVNE